MTGQAAHPRGAARCPCEGRWHRGRPRAGGHRPLPSLLSFLTHLARPGQRGRRSRDKAAGPPAPCKPRRAPGAGAAAAASTRGAHSPAAPPPSCASAPAPAPAPRCPPGPAAGGGPGLPLLRLCQRPGRPSEGLLPPPGSARTNRLLPARGGGSGRAPSGWGTAGAGLLRPPAAPQVTNIYNILCGFLRFFFS